jgi:uncharacterized tellurite resistance protein B-like protein
VPDLNYSLITPLIAQTDVSGSYVNVVFQCPVSGDEIRAQGSVVQSAGAAMKSEVKRSLWRNVRWSLSRMMYSVFGYGVGGAVGSVVVDAAGSVADAKSYQPTPAELEGAIVEAFKSVSNRFAWDESNQRFVSASVFKDLQTEFTVLVQSTRIAQAWDRGVLARMLAEIAQADGTLAEGEREFFYTFLEGQQSLDDILDKPPLSKADLEETSADARHVMWLLAAAMAVSDQDFAPAEAQKLAFFGKALGVSDKDQARGLELAKEYILDQALEAAYADGKMNRAEHAQIAELAQKLGITEDRAARLDARCRKRKGIH